jgi:ketose-bisphosphate aldolase
MPLVKLKPLLEDARKNRYCLGSFNVFNIETLQGVIEAAVNCRSPVICGIYEPHFKRGDVEVFTTLVKTIANTSGIPVVLHLDHAQDISSIETAIAYGFTSLMYDGTTDMSFEEKMINTKRVVEIAHQVELTVESELGRVTRIGIDDDAVKENITDPSMVQEFVQETGIDVLAPAIGSISGMNVQDARLNLQLLKRIRNSSDCYLSLHGGSGVQDALWKKLIDIGINKASYYTRISNTAIQRMRALMVKPVPDLALLTDEVRDVFREKVEDRLTAFRSKNSLNA